MPTLLTRDEAHTRFARSACSLVLEIDTSRMALARYLARHGSLANLSTRDRHAVVDHWALMDELKERGLSDVIEEELDGILSIVIDPETSTSVLADYAWADRNDPNQQDIGAWAA